MNIAGPILCVFLCFVGGIYSLWLLFDCCRQFRLPEIHAEATEMPIQKSRVARIDQLCQVVVAVVYLVAASGVFVAIARQHRAVLCEFCQDAGGSLFAFDGTAARPLRRLYSFGNSPGEPVMGADLADMPMTEEDLIVLVRQHPQLEWLNLTDTHVSDSQLKRLTGLRHLECLTLTRDPISDEGLQPLLALRKLRDLGLAGTLITDDGLALLSKIEDLEHLDVCRTAITDTGLRSLCRLHHLRQLDVSKTAVSRQAVEELMNSLPELEKVRHDKWNGMGHVSKKTR